MPDPFRLIPALQIIFEKEVEFTKDSFAELTPEQYEAYVRRGGEPSERVFRLTFVEPQVIDRTPEKVTWELEIVTNEEKKLLLEGVRFVYRASAPMTIKKPTFAQRLEYLRKRLPPIVCNKPPE